MLVSLWFPLKDQFLVVAHGVLVELASVHSLSNTSTVRLKAPLTVGCPTSACWAPQKPSPTSAPHQPDLGSILYSLVRHFHSPGGSLGFGPV